MKPTETQPKSKSSFDYCLDFWKDALDTEDEIDHFVREMPRHIRTADDVA